MDSGHVGAAKGTAVVEQIVADRFQNVLAKGRKLLSHHIVRSSSQRDRIELEPFLEWHSQSLALLGTIFGPDHAFTKSFENSTTIKGFPQSHVSNVQAGIGVLVGAGEDISRGWAWEYREFLHREVFDDFLDMADHLLKEGGYKEAAAVLAGSALEGHLRMLSQKHDIPISKVAAMNEALWKKDVYSKPTWRDVQAWYDLRTVAAHDTERDYSAEQVNLMIAGIRGFIGRHPA
jgi:hypothetical protein